MATARSRLFEETTCHTAKPSMSRHIDVDASEIDATRRRNDDASNYHNLIEWPLGRRAASSSAEQLPAIR